MNAADKIFFQEKYGTTDEKEIKKMKYVLNEEMDIQRMNYALYNTFMPNKEHVLNISNRIYNTKKVAAAERKKFNIPFGQPTPTEKLLKDIDQKVLLSQFIDLGFNDCQASKIVENIFKTYSDIQSLNASDYVVDENLEARVKPEKDRYARVMSRHENEKE